MRAPENLAVCAFESPPPALTQPQWERLLAAWRRKGSTLSVEETLRVVEANVGDDRDL